MDSTILNLYNCLLHKIVLQGCHKQMIVFSRNEGFHALVLNTYANDISFLSKGQQVVAQLRDRICPQVVDDLPITIHLLCTASNLSETLKSSLPTIEEIEAELGEIDG